MKLSSRILFSLSFIEGASVMATEVIGAKLLAPFFGSSLYVWSSVMAITLGGLALGYFIGGRQSQKGNPEIKCMSILLIVGIIILLMPLTSAMVLPLSFILNLLPAVVLCSVVVLLPPVFLMGMVSPLIISSLTKNGESAGKRAGEVYAVSTAGGIAATFLTGFLLIPEFGLRTPLFCTGLLILLFPLYYFLRTKNKKIVPFFIAVPLASLLSFYSEKTKAGSLIKSEGLLGTVEVLHFIEADTAKRVLLINNIIQTYTNKDNSVSFLPYVNELDELLPTKGEGKKALLLGLGGGAVANKLIKKKYSVTAIELDNRIAMIAKKYFNLSPSVEVIVDDARHAINEIDSHFDFILFDMFSAEVAPSHVMSIEAFEKIKELMNDSCVLVFNTYGYLNPPAGNGNLSLIKTLKEANFNVKVKVIGKERQEDFRSLLIIASNVEVGKVSNEYLLKQDLKAIEITTDDKPMLEFLNAEAAKRWRYYYLKNYISYFK